MELFVNFDTYRAIDAVNWSTLHEMDKSPRHYQYRLTHPRPDTKETALGRAVHAACFEAFRFAQEFVAYPKRRQGKAWLAFQAEHLPAGRTILTAAEYAKAEAMRDAVNSHPLLAPYLEAGEGEKVIRWTDPMTGLPCKSRDDWISRSKPAVVDLKSTKDASEHRFASQVAKLGYYGQGAFYVDGVRHSTGAEDELPFVLAAVESDPPHDVAVYVLDPDAIYAGRCLYQDLLKRVVACREANRWPGRYESEQMLRLPPWVFDDEDDATGLDLDYDQGETT